MNIPMKKNPFVFPPQVQYTLYRCKCRMTEMWSSDPVPQCVGCKECGTTLERFGNGHVNIQKHRYYIVSVETDFGISQLTICMQCKQPKKYLEPSTSVAEAKDMRTFEKRLEGLMKGGEEQLTEMDEPSKLSVFKNPSSGTEDFYVEAALEMQHEVEKALGTLIEAPSAVVHDLDVDLNTLPDPTIPITPVFPIDN